MESRKFSSPREEALKIALETRKGILEGKRDAESVLRACLVIAKNLNKNNESNWISLELSGYVNSLNLIPEYRKINCNIVDGYEAHLRWEDMNLWQNIHELSSYHKAKKSLRIAVGKKIDSLSEIAVITTIMIDSLLDTIIDRCLFFLNDIIAELQYGGIVEYLMEEIRKGTDEKLALDQTIFNEVRSLTQNLSSTNPADWNKVGHSCRKILQLLADKIFPSREEQYKMKDGRLIEVGDKQYINRLCAFFDQKTSSEERKFLMAETGYLESYLRQVVEYDQMGEHKPSIEKFHADMMAIHTYLIASEILKHT